MEWISPETFRCGSWRCCVPPLPPSPRASPCQPATFADAATVVAAVRAGDVLLLRSRWLMSWAGYEEALIKVERWEDLHDSHGRELHDVQGWKKVHKARPLPCRQEIEAQYPDAIFSADELLQNHGNLRGGGEFDALPVFSVSHCWEDRNAPDPEARTLAAIARYRWAQRLTPKRRHTLAAHSNSGAA